MSVKGATSKFKIPSDIMAMIEAAPRSATPWADEELEILDQCKQRRVMPKEIVKILQAAGYERSLTAIERRSKR